MSKPPPKSSKKSPGKEGWKKSAPFVPPPGSCVFCLSNEDCQDKFGKKITKYGVTVHYFCMLFASGLCQNGKTEKEGIFGFMPKDINRETTRGKRLRCIHCQHVGATIGCVVPKCRKVFHFHCGIENGALNQYYGNFSSFCEEHRPRQSKTVPKGERLAFKGTGNSSCAICMQAVPARAKNNTLRTPCCRSAWYHRACIQRQALCAGLHFFKCPLCNNKDIFQDEMLEFGIYIPDQDAAWELEPNAFQELLQRHSRCDVEPCKCPHGRDYNKEEDKKWEIVLCDWCGSQGCHIVCGKLKRQSDDWICPECIVIGSPVAKKKKGKSPRAAAASPKYEKDWYEQKSKSEFPGPSAYSLKRKRTSTAGTYDPRKKPRLMECSVVLERRIPRHVTATVTSATLKKMEESAASVPTVRRRSWLQRQASDASNESSKECLDEVTLQNRPKWFQDLMNEDIVTGRSLGNKLASYKEFATSHVIVAKSDENPGNTAETVSEHKKESIDQKSDLLGDGANPEVETKASVLESGVPDTDLTRSVLNSSVTETTLTESLAESKVPTLDSKQGVPKSSPRWLKKLMSSDIFTGVNLGSKFSTFTTIDGANIGKNIIKRSATEATKTPADNELSRDEIKSHSGSPVPTVRTPSNKTSLRKSTISDNTGKSPFATSLAYTPQSAKLEHELRDTPQRSSDRRGRSASKLTTDSNTDEGSMSTPHCYEKVHEHSMHVRRSLVYAKAKKKKVPTATLR